MAYGVGSPPSLSNLHDVFHVSKLHKYLSDESHVIQIDDEQVKDNFTVEASPLQIDEREVKHLRGKEIVLVKLFWEDLLGVA